MQMFKLFNADRQRQNHNDYLLEIQAGQPHSFEELEDYAVKLSNGIVRRFGKDVTRDCHVHIIIDSQDFTQIMNIRNKYEHKSGIKHILSFLDKHFQKQSERIILGGKIWVTISGDERHNSIDLESGHIIIATHDQLYNSHKGAQSCAKIEVCVGQDKNVNYSIKIKGFLL